MAATPIEAAMGNQPGGATCPDWLLRLDDPDPGRVVFVGEPDPVAMAWFFARCADISVVEPDGRLPVAPDLLVLDGPSTRRGPRPPLDRGWLGVAGAVVLARAPSTAWKRALTEAGLGTIRAVDPERRKIPGRRLAGTAHVAVRTRAGAPSAAAPAWLAQVAASTVPEAPCTGWSLHVPSAYPSQKAVARLATAPPDARPLVVKVTRHPRFNARIENESSALAALHRRGGAVAPRVPVERGTALVAGMAATVQDAVVGRPFLARSALVADCPLADDAARAITDLGAATFHEPVARPRRHREAGEVCSLDHLDEILDAFVERMRPDRSATAFLLAQVAQLRHDPPPTVLFHGDLGTWNLLVDEADRVCILDWESAEPHGPPLWDLFYFLRSYAVRAGRRRGLDREHAIGRHLLGSSPIALQGAAWVAAYCQRLGLDRRLVEPLFHTCWMHRAVKEQRRLEDGRPGHYGPLCLRFVDQREAPGLRRLVDR